MGLRVWWVLACRRSRTAPGLEAFLADFVAAVDWPAAAFWWELSEACAR